MRWGFLYALLDINPAPALVSGIIIIFIIIIIIIIIITIIIPDPHSSPKTSFTARTDW